MASRAEANHTRAILDDRMSEALRLVEQGLAGLPPRLQDAARRHWEALAPALVSHLDDPLHPERRRIAQALPRVLAASEFVARAAVAEPETLAELVTSGDLLRAYPRGELAARAERAIAGVEDEADLKRRLRRLRRREMLRLAFRDLAGFAGTIESMADASALADACLEAALATLASRAQARYGVPRPVGEGDGRRPPPPAGLVVLALGKLGGEELNFSSDIDLIFAYTADGETDGPQTISNHEYFVRLGQALIDTLAQPTADGFVFRVDMRLRPNGASGPLALSFDAMEQYYQVHGREWERYALIKARPCAGERAAGEALVARLEPFVYRKYLDYGTLEAIRDMKALIEREVARRGVAQHIKLGPGGIREIEFIVQTLQLIRGGREPQLKVRHCLEALARLAKAGHLSEQTYIELRDAYLFLRNTEHRLQEAHDQQTHTLPADELERARLAFAMGFPDWPAFEQALAQVRRRVEAHFAQLFSTARDAQAVKGGIRGVRTSAGLAAIWHEAADTERAASLAREAGYRRPDEVLRLLDGLRRSDAYLAFSAEGRTRVDRLVPLLLAEAARTPDPETTLARLVNLLESLGRRSAYFALLVESASAREQLTRLAAASPWIANWIARHPILLDELIDPRSLYAPFDRDALAAELEERLRHIPPDDLELQMEVLREFRHAQVLRVAAADVGPGLPAEETGRRLAAIADTVIAGCLALAEGALTARHGPPRCPPPPAERRPGFAVIGYGKLGGRELGYTSDLDMIFLYEGCPDGTTAGPRPLANEEYFARLGQRLIHLLSTRTAGGILYEVDMRLRPSGKSGPLVSSLEAFADYQRTRAWTWEHQALVRARFVAGAEDLRRGFEAVRHEVLRLEREADKLRQDVREMRAKMLAAHRRTAPAGSGSGEGFDLKHDPGGIVDIEFMVQYAVLRWAHAHPVLTRHTDNLGILKDLEAEGLLDAATARTLADAYRRYLSLEHRTKLMERTKVERAELADWPQRVRRIWETLLEEPLDSA